MIEIATSVAFLVSSMYGIGVSHVMPVSIGSDEISVTSKTSTETVSRFENIRSYVTAYYADTPLLIEVARCESGFAHYDNDGQVVRGKINKNDVGVMQINEKYHLETARKMGIDIHTIEGNVAYGKHLYEKFGAAPWKASAGCWSKSIMSNQVAVK